LSRFEETGPELEGRKQNRGKKGGGEDGVRGGQKLEKKQEQNGPPIKPWRAR